MMKKLSVFILLLSMALPFGASAETLTGDVNGDGKITIADVTALINLLLSQPQNPEPEEDYVDLGLPSGTLWATRNVGATSPEDYGDYFAWGETEPKDVYNVDTYKWYNSDNNSSGFTKYCNVDSMGYNGFIDGKVELDAADDPACVHYPNGRMPSWDQIKELHNSCTWQWTTRNDVNGYLVTGPNGNTLFLPAAGERHNGWLYALKTEGYYWSRTLVPRFPDQAYCFIFFSDSSRPDTSFRDFGYSVRAVRASRD